MRRQRAGQAQPPELLQEALKQSPAWQERRALPEPPELLAGPSGQADSMAAEHGGPVRRRNSRQEVPSRAGPKSLQKILPVKPAGEAALPEKPLFPKVRGAERQTSLVPRNPPTPKLGKTLAAAGDLAAVAAEGPADSTAAGDLAAAVAEGPTDSAVEANLAAAWPVKPSGTPAGWAAALSAGTVSMSMSEMISTTVRLARAAAQPRIQSPRVRLLAALEEAGLPVQQELRRQWIQPREEAAAGVERAHPGRNLRGGKAVPSGNWTAAPPKGTEQQRRLNQGRAVLISQGAVPLRIQTLHQNGGAPAWPSRNSALALLLKHLPQKSEDLLSVLTVPREEGAAQTQVRFCVQNGRFPARSGRNRLRSPRPPGFQQEAAGRLRRPARQGADTVPIREIPAVSGTEAPARPGGNCPEAQFPGEGFKKTVLPKFTPA